MPHLRIRSLTVALLALVIVRSAPAAQTVAAGPQVLTFYSEVDDTEQPYALYLPRDYDSARSYPLVVSLHGAGSNHRLNLKRVFGHSNVAGETDVEASRYFPEWEDVEYIVAAPFARGTMGYQGIAEKDVLDVLADVQRRFAVDEDRIYLTGLSMGGGGTLWLGLTRPDIWAAIAPVCPAPPAGTEVYAGNALNIPIRIFQGGADPVVRPESTRAWVERLREIGAEVEYDEYPGVMHDSWVQAYRDGQIFDWFALHKRDPHPDRVRHSAEQYRYREAYWVALDAFTPGRTASLDVAFTSDDELRATTTELDGFTLHLQGHPRRSAADVVDLAIDGQRIRVSGAEDSISFRKVSGRWRVGRYDAAAFAKGPGEEGPMAEVIADRHVYVYGTADDPPAEVLASRRRQAEIAADWAVYRGPFLGRVMVFPRVLSDRQVRPTDVREANLVLFGTKETNSLIAQYASRLPIHLDPDAQGYGLAYVYPNEGRYLLVNSGLPWWHSPPGGGSQPPGPLFGVQVEAMRLMNFGDFLLFQERPDQPLASGRFDATWQLPPDAAQAMEATGVVTLESGAAGSRE